MFWDFFKHQEEIQNKQFWVILEKDILFGEKKYFFDRVRLKTAERKKDETKRRRKTKGVSQRDEKIMKKGDWKRNTKILQWKERKGILFFWKKCEARKKKESKHEEGGQRESEHQEGTHKERKHEKSQNKEKKERETWGWEWGRLKKRKEIWTGIIFVDKEYQK